jgi:lactate dehydrogenase-like 2-hydroxyacid dehydrogenase
MNPSVAVSRQGLPGTKLDELRQLLPVRCWTEEAPPSMQQLAALASEADALLCVNGDPVTDELLAVCPRLRLIAVASAGFDSVDINAARSRGVAVTNTPGVLHEATADLAFGLILASRRRLVEGDRWVRAGRWRDNSLGNLVGHDVHGTRLGIVGYGQIGRAVARRAVGFNMTVVHYSRTSGDDGLSTWTPLEELLATSDVVSLHTPLTPETRGLIGPAELSMMKSTATLVNTARGAVVDEPALIEALRTGQILSAGLDVQVLEPNPNPHHPLLELDNCVVLPHIGSATFASRAAMIDLAAENVLAYLAGGDLVSPVIVKPDETPARSDP